jgi:phosphocarrier protein
MELVRTLRLRNDLGLHARAAARIVTMASQCASSLTFRKDGMEVDGSSILSILTLSCPKGSDVEVRVVGKDAEELMQRLEELFEDRFGELK